jgi:hypothetical protein
MITTSNSPMKGSGIPNQFLGVLLYIMAISGLSRVRTELFQLLVIPSLAPHPVETNRQPAPHRNFRRLASAPHHQVEILAAPLRHAAHRHLRRFDQQETQQRVTLLRDVAQAAPIAARVFEWHKSEITRYLLAALKALGLAAPREQDAE